MKKSKKELRFIKLGTWLLEQKCIYYLGLQNYGRKVVSDLYYDKIEKLYNRIGLEIGKTRFVSNITDFPIDRPSGRLIYENLRYSKRPGIKLLPEDIKGMNDPDNFTEKYDVTEYD